LVRLPLLKVEITFLIAVVGCCLIELIKMLRQKAKWQPWHIQSQGKKHALLRGRGKSSGWPDGYFSGHFWQLWLFLGAVFYKKNFFGYILVWWLFCGYFSIFKKKNSYLAILWLFLVLKSISALY